jgi:stage III sporulation protein AA
MIMGRELITRHFRGEVRTALEKLCESDFSRCQEIRLRVDRCLSVFAGNEMYTVSGGNLLLAGDPRGGGVTVTAQDIKFCFESICQYSVHSFAKEIRNGFITVPGGHRAGFCGTAVAGDDTIGEPGTIKHINAINFRIAREVKGAADRLFRALNGCHHSNPDPSHSNSPISVLICGGVGSGKTTLLRDLARLAGNRMKVALIDCRGELAAVSSGVPAHDVGAFTDVFDGYTKEGGIETAVRVMSPALIVCDEIGGERDIAALNYARLSGVAVAASVHAASLESLRERIPGTMFDLAVFLNGSDEPTQIREIVDLKSGKIIEPGVVVC